MPSGKIHTTVTLLVTLPAMILTNELIGTPGPAMVAGVGCISGVLITPDLDLGNGKMPWSSGKLLGKMGAKLWKWLWYPYSALVPHRSWISHSPILSTLLRIVYLTWPMLILWPQFFKEPLFYAFVVGLMVSDVFHIIFDEVF